jgi:hypothetical protein
MKDFQLLQCPRFGRRQIVGQERHIPALIDAMPYQVGGNQDVVGRCGHRKKQQVYVGQSVVQGEGVRSGQIADQQVASLRVNGSVKRGYPVYGERTADSLYWGRVRVGGGP